MALIHWSKSVSGAFNTSDDWSGGRVPGPNDDAILDAPGSTAYTVSVTSNVTVSSIQTAANALLDIEADFSATRGTGSGVNAGAIRIENDGTLTLQGTVENAGSIEIFGTVSTTTIVLGSGGVTLAGTGAVFLNFTGGKYQQIIPAAGGSVLTLAQRISGQGLIGGSGLSIVTEADGGFLEAKGGLLTINTGAHTIVNGGLIDAEGYPSYPYVAGQGVVESPVENNGVVEVDGKGATMTFEDAVTGDGRGIVTGGVLRFDSSFNQEVGFTRTTGELSLAHSIAYTAPIVGFSASGGEFLDLSDISFVGAGQATYSGTVSRGVLTVTDGTHTAYIHFEGNYTASAFTSSSDGDGGTLITAGLKAIDWLNTTNGMFQTAANWAGGIVPGTYNDAVLGAGTGATYTVTASTAKTIAGLQGAANAHLTLSAPMTITDGTDGGMFAGVISVINGGRLTIGGTFDNTGQIALNASIDLAELVVTGATTLTGGGTIEMRDQTASAIVGASPSAVLTNLEVIAGAGTLGGGGLTLINEAAGSILSEVAGKTLVINTGANTIVNAGLLNGAAGGMRVTSAVENDGVVRAVTALTFSRAVTGSGHAVIAGGALRFLSTFDQAVTFTGGGVLGLALSRLYSGTINGFATAGADSLDLADVAFTGATKATFSGNASNGVLTVTDGTHTAHISLHGNYTGVTFLAATDGQGGTMVTDTTARPRAELHLFIAAMAGHADGAAAPITATPLMTPRLMILASSR